MSNFAEDWIDVSAHQGVIDWAQVARAGIKGVVIRAGYGNSAGQIDKQFIANIKGAVDAGLKVAIYWFHYFDSTDDALKEWSVCKAIIEPFRANICFVASDYEYDSVKYFRRIHGAPPQNDLINQMVDAFCMAAEADGWKAKVYTNNDYRKNVFTPQLLAKRSVWLADYTGAPDVPCDIQQTGSTGRVPGIAGNVDMNTCFVEYIAPQSVKPTPAPVPQPAPAPAPVPTPATPSTYAVNRQLPGYLTAADAAAHRNARGTVAPGTYSIYNTSGNMINVTRAERQPGSWINPADNSGAAAPAPQSTRPVMREGATVQYSGSLYADSYGGGQGKTVSGTFRVDIYKPGRKFGAHIASPSGWVQQSACKVVG